MTMTDRRTPGSVRHNNRSRANASVGIPVWNSADELLIVESFASEYRTPRYARYGAGVRLAREWSPRSEAGHRVDFHTSEPRRRESGNREQRYFPGSLVSPRFQ
jgi:hypothetical protein